MNPISFKTPFAAVLGILPLAPGPAIAETVLIDWATATSITTPAGDGKYWNSLGSNSATSPAAASVPETDLIDSVTGLDSGFNVAVAVNFTGTTSKEGAAFGGNGISGPSGPDPFDESAATTDGIFANFNSKGTAVVTFTDLAASSSYDFVAIGGRASGGNDGLITVLQGASGSGTYTLGNDGAVLSFSVTSTAGGIIQLDFSEGLDDGTGTTNSTWNAMSMTGSPAGPDEDPPTLAGSDIVDDQSGGPVTVGTPITYTLTFSEDMDHLTFNPTDFWDSGGDVSLGFLSITETSPGVFEVVVTPDNAGTLEFQVNAGATLNDAAGNPLDTTAAIVDDTAITVNAAPGGITGGTLWTEWYRPVDSPVFSISDGNNHDPIIFYEPSGSTYKYYLIISHETSNAFLWGANSFSWNSADWTLINGNYQINGQYEYDDAVKVGGTYHLYEDGKVLTYTGDLANSNGNWTQAGTFPKSQCDDIGVFYENGVFHIFGENGVYPDGFDGLRLSHYTSTTGVGNWTLVDTHAVDPNPDGGTTYGVGDATIAKVDGIYYLFCDRESVGSPYRVTAWATTDLNQPFTCLGIAFEPREGETDDWDNHRIQDADIQYIPELKRFIMVCNMMDTDGSNPDGVPPFLPNGATRVVGTFYSKITDGGFDAYLEGFAGLTGPDALVDADPDGDGATNGEEYAGGTLPDDPSSFPLYDYAILEDGGVHYPAIVFDRITVDPQTTRSGEGSNAGSLAPGAFFPTDGVESATGMSGAGAWYEEVIYRSTTPVSSSTSQFLRVRTTISPPP